MLNNSYLFKYSQQQLKTRPHFSLFLINLFLLHVSKRVEELLLRCDDFYHFSGVTLMTPYFLVLLSVFKMTNDETLNTVRPLFDDICCRLESLIYKFHCFVLLLFVYSFLSMNDDTHPCTTCM